MWMVRSLPEQHVHIDSRRTNFVLCWSEHRRNNESAKQEAISMMILPRRHIQNLYPAATPITLLAFVGALTGEDSIRRYSSEKRR